MTAAKWAGVAAAALLASCGGEPRLERLEPDAVVLAFGDSLTHGTGAAADESYPAVLARAIGRKVVNAGVPGETSAQGLARLPETLERTRPRLLILCHGGNDFLRGLDPGQAAGNLRAMIAVAREAGVPVVLVATPRPSLPPAVPSFYGEIAAELRIPFEESVMRRVLGDHRLKSDLVHPNASGYAQIAAAVEKKLRATGAL